MRHAIDHRFVARAQVAKASLAAGGAAMAFLSSNMTIFAAVDLLALVGSIFFIWRAARRMWRFIGVWRLTSFRRALWRSRHAALKQAFRCATDEIYYLSRLTLLFSANLLAVGAVIFAALGAAHVSRRDVEMDCRRRAPAVRGVRDQGLPSHREPREKGSGDPAPLADRVISLAPAPARPPIADRAFVSSRSGFAGSSGLRILPRPARGCRFPAIAGKARQRAGGPK